VETFRVYSCTSGWPPRPSKPVTTLVWRRLCYKASTCSQPEILFSFVATRVALTCIRFVCFNDFIFESCSVIVVLVKALLESQQVHQHWTEIDIWWCIVTLMMEVVRTSETSVYFTDRTRRHIPSLFSFVTVITFIATEGPGRVLNTPVSYLGGSRFKSWPRDRLSWRVFVVSRGYDLKLKPRPLPSKVFRIHYLVSPFHSTPYSVSYWKCVVK
jgi:hypothetical protein